MCICMHIDVCCVRVYVYMCVCMYTWTCVWMCARVCVLGREFVGACEHLCVYASDCV